MKRVASIAVIALIAGIAVVPLAAQTPKGWMVRADRSTSATDPDGAGAIKFVSMGTGYHATTPQAAVFWNPANTVTGNYSLKGTFTLVQPSGHVNYYGLVFGGSGLESSAQNYLYFMVAQDGTWLIKRRNGDVATEDVKGKTPHDAVRKPDAKGTSTNALEVRVQGDKIDYLINGTLVHTTPKAGLTAKTDGLYGMRVNHLLEVHADGLAVSKL
jgi:hypothetical protein